MSETPRLALPLLAVAQAQKEFTVNEALQLLDVLVGGCVEGPPQANPPEWPAVGAAYLIASGATGAWAGKSDCIAGWTSGGWRFISPTPGMQVMDRDSGIFSIFRDGVWDRGHVRATGVEIDGVHVVGPQAAAIAAPTGGSTVDAEARTAIDEILAALEAHGLIAG